MFSLETDIMLARRIYLRDKATCSFFIYTSAHPHLICTCVLTNPFSLKILGLYLYTLIIGHKSCNMLSILNKLIWQKELKFFVIKMRFEQKSKITTTTKQKQSNIKTLAGDRVWTLDLLHPKRMRYHCNSRNVNKQSQICGPDIFNRYIFL